ncbi:MAG: MBL fold metallo-hydrolase [Alphaproteobacteria bacterium]|nr:MBL fold metallo-hydrolase [Alphaproteobacteria bacterium]
MAVEIPFIRDFETDYGSLVEVSPSIRRVVARNPGLFTFKGTGTYIVGRGQVAVIDPGPDLVEHVEALKNALRGETVSHILVTHTHIDHSPAAKALKAATGAPTLGFGPHGGERGGDKVEEGGDHDFRPDHALADGDVVSGRGWTFTALHTPGHTSNHLCYALKEEAALFSGDHVMGWSTTVISPPDGDMRAYMASLDKLRGRSERRFIPTHGAPIPEPGRYVEALIAHRREREGEILACLRTGPATIPEMVKVIYAQVDPRLHGAAARSVFAHIRHMVEDGRVKAEGPPALATLYRLP